MGILSWLFGSPQAETRPIPVRLAKGRGYTFEVVGEAAYQGRLNILCGGKCEDGHNLERDAQIVFVSDNEHDPEAVGVMMDGAMVGFIPRHLAPAFRADILRINPEERPVICSAKIVGGWDRGDGDEGHYGVKLSLSKPLRLV